MIKIIILIPVFNDWQSLEKLLIEINHNIEKINNIVFDCIIVNDASTIDQTDFKKPSNFNSLRILNMKNNQGHARCNAFGLRYVTKNEKFNYLILMDGDGEDRPVEIQSLLNVILKDPNKSVVAKRVKRSEGQFFQLLYKIHKIITFLFTGKKINFGNYSCLTEKDVKKLSDKASLWSSFSGSVKKNLKDLNEINSIRGLRYFGPSKMSILKLLIHSFSIIAVFKYQVLFRTLIIVLLLYPLNSYLGSIAFISQLTILLFCILIFIVSLREKENELIKSKENLKDIHTIH